MLGIGDGSGRIMSDTASIRQRRRVEIGSGRERHRHRHGSDNGIGSDARWREWSAPSGERVGSAATEAVAATATGTVGIGSDGNRVLGSTTVDGIGKAGASVREPMLERSEGRCPYDPADLEGGANATAPKETCGFH